MPRGIEELYKVLSLVWLPRGVLWGWALGGPMDFGRGAPGAEERLKYAKKQVRQNNAKSRSDWEDAVERGEHRRVRQLLEQGQAINEIGKRTGSAAHYIAARKNDAFLLKYLLDNGADPLVLTDDDVSAAWISISKGYVGMLVILLTYYPMGHKVRVRTDTPSRARRDRSHAIPPLRRRLP